MKTDFSHFAFCLLVTLASVLSSHAAENDFVYNREAFRQITYEWTDDNDPTVKHTSNLAEPATTLNQMRAFIGAVNKHREIPGTKELPVDENGTMNQIRWTRSYISDSRFGMGPEDTNPVPYENGPTLILGKAKDNWRQINSETYNRVESLEILFARTRVEGENPGWVFEIESSVNFFFLLSKGRMRENRGQSFWGDGFEELSPTGEKGLGEFDAETHNRLINGETYPIEHDCSIMLSNSHYFGMSGAYGTTRYLHNLLIFLPDKRMVAWSGRDLGTQTYTYYNPNYLPYLFDYTISLEASLPENLENTMTYQPTLSWQSSFKKVTKSTGDAVFSIYRIDENDVRTRVPAEQIHPLGTATVDPDGTVHSTELSISVRVDEERSEQSQQVRYIVSGRPADMVDATPANSNVADVYVAGKESFTISIARDYHADYQYFGSQAQNLYVNDITLRDNAEAEAEMRITRSGIPVGAEFRLNRIVRDNNGDIAEPLHVATLRITSIDLDEQSSRYLYRYEMVYDDAVIPADLRTEADAKFPFSPVPCMALWSEYSGNEAADNAQYVKGLGTDGAFANMRDVCRLAVDDTNHPSAYSYSITYIPRPADQAAEADQFVSNFVSVPSITTALSLGLQTYSLDEILADSAHELSPSRATATFSVVNNPRVLEYQLRRSDDDGSTYHTLATASQAGTTGDYYVQTVRPDGTQIEDFTSQGIFADDQQTETLVTLPVYDNPLDSRSRLVVNIITQPAGADYRNSYGSEMVSLPQLPDLEVLESDHAYVRNEQGIMEYVITHKLRLNPGADGMFSPGGIAAWRQITLPDNSVLETQITGFDSFAVPTTDGITELGTEITPDNCDPSVIYLKDNFTLNQDGSQKLSLKYTFMNYNALTSDRLAAQSLDSEARYVLSSKFAPIVMEGIIPTSLDDIPSDSTPARFFTLQGIEVTGRTLAPGIYIRLQGTTAQRVIIP